METARGAEGTECGAAASTATDRTTRRAAADSGYAGFWRPWVDAGGKKEEETPNHAAEAMPDGPGMTAASGKLSQFRHPVSCNFSCQLFEDYFGQNQSVMITYIKKQKLF
ncbi:protein ripply2 isoform X3 [Papio anubis]|uniref:protein ripply2 isoform X3 n=1 Tax=Papio anubis TaxID=9555 RepID=UPI0004F212AF|nr:protein ripply2 isoform X3 [Papio anubis]